MRARLPTDGLGYVSGVAGQAEQAVGDGRGCRDRRELVASRVIHPDEVASATAPSYASLSPR